MLNLLIRIKIKFLNPKFRKWIELEEQRENISRAVAEKREEFPKLIFEFLSTALNINKRKFEKLCWEKVIGYYILVSLRLRPKFNIPLLQPATEKTNKEIWEYDGRAWHLYSHLFAHAYGWSLEYIENLSVYSAITHIQEILVQTQLDREFLWNMSEAAVIYDTQTKSSRPNPLPRPKWMKSTEEVPIKKFKLPKGLMPSGNVNLSGVDDEFKPKEIS